VPDGKNRPLPLGVHRVERLSRGRLGRQGAGKVSFTGGRLRRWLSNESPGFFSQSAKSSNVEDLDLSLLILFTTPARRCRLLCPFPAQTGVSYWMRRGNPPRDLGLGARKIKMTVAKGARSSVPSNFMRPLIQRLST
jgi:hypothetical protein